MYNQDQYIALYYENVCATMSDISWSNWCARHTANYISSMTYHNLHHILYKNDFITNGISASAYTRPTTHHHSPATHLILNHHKLWICRAASSGGSGVMLRQVQAFAALASTPSTNTRATSWLGWVSSFWHNCNTRASTVPSRSWTAYAK